MNSRLQKALINDVNFRFFGVELKKLYYSSGSLIATKLMDSFGKDKSYSFVCGLGGNASDGLATAIELIKQKIDVNVYIVGRVSYSGSSIFKELFEELDELRVLYKNLSIKQECYADDIQQDDLIVECLVGTGLEGKKLNKRFSDCISRVSHFKSKLIAIDIPAPSYTPDLVISLNYPKIDSAVTVEVPESKDASFLCGPGEVKFLFNSKQKTHKAKNGKILYISSTRSKAEFEGIKNAAKCYSCDLYIYNFNTDLKELKGFNFVSDLEIENCYEEADSVVFGTVDEKSLINTNLIKHLISLDKDKKMVLTWHVKEIIENFKDLEMLKESILILNRNTIDSALKDYGISERSLSQVTQTNIFFGGFQNTLYSRDGESKININPKLTNESSAKSLANICAAILTKNDAWLALRSSVFLFEVSSKLNIEAKTTLEENLKEAIDLCKEF